MLVTAISLHDTPRALVSLQSVLNGERGEDTRAESAEGLARHLAGVTFRAPTIPVLTSVEARPVKDADDIAALLVRQVTAPVRWEETMRALGARGATLALETGPGRVLCGLARRIVPELPAVPAGDAEGVERASEALRGAAR